MMWTQHLKCPNCQSPKELLLTRVDFYYKNEITTGKPINIGAKLHMFAFNILVKTH